MSASFVFTQEGNCIDGGSEELTIRCLSDLGVDCTGGCFYVLNTGQWSFDSVEELQELIDRIKPALSSTNITKTNKSKANA